MCCYRNCVSALTSYYNGSTKEKAMVSPLRVYGFGVEAKLKQYIKT